jgi:hypothetical protein
MKLFAGINYSLTGLQAGDKRWPVFERKNKCGGFLSRRILFKSLESSQQTTCNRNPAA